MKKTQETMEPLEVSGAFLELPGAETDGPGQYLSVPAYDVSYEEFLHDLERSVFGQEAELEGIAYDIHSYLQGVSRGKPVKHNFILAGPSASGKTELYRSVKKLLGKYGCGVPVLLLDCSGFTPAGFQGGETSVIPEMIRDAGSGGEAVVFLDEFDKILTPLPTSSGNDMNMVLQHELLTMTEGNVFPVRRNGRSCPVNTGKTLFIAMGAFTEYREEKDKRRGQISLGFTSGKEAPAGDSGRLSMEDLRRAGGRTELLGRFDHLYNFRPAGEKAFGDLFRHFIEELAIEQEIFIRATGAAVREFFSLAESEYGCREVKRTLYDTVKPCLIRMADETERINSCIVVRGIGKAVLEVRKPVSGHRQ